MDKMQVYNHDGIDYRECVSCGFKDQIRIASANESKLESTKVQSAKRLAKSNLWTHQKLINVADHSAVSIVLIRVKR